MPTLAEPPAPVLPDLSRPPQWFEDANEDPAPEDAFFWTCLGKRKKGPNGKDVDPFRWHLCIFRHREDAERFSALPHPHWTWDGLPAFHITPEQARGLARRKGHTGVVLKAWNGEGWDVLKTWDA